MHKSEIETMTNKLKIKRRIKGKTRIDITSVSGHCKILKHYQHSIDNKIPGVSSAINAAISIMTQDIYSNARHDPNIQILDIQKNPNRVPIFLQLNNEQLVVDFVYIINEGCYNIINNNITSPFHSIPLIIHTITNNYYYCRMANPRAHFTSFVQV